MVVRGAAAACEEIKRYYVYDHSRVNSQTPARRARETRLLMSLGIDESCQPRTAKTRRNHSRHALVLLP